MKPAAVALSLAVAGLAGGRDAAAEGPGNALFALIVGVNASPSPELARLRYADDDAARYLELFRSLGARTYVLSRLDDNTRRLHPQVAAEALPPRRAELTRAIEGLARDIAQARARGVRSTLYVIYAGHGDLSATGWALTLEDGRIEGSALVPEVVERAGADQAHVIVDACHAYLLALPRGPGGDRRPAHGFVALEEASRAGRIGYLLSSSASGESHEWAGFEAGVFSHEVRSGLFGAADADGDGLVTYPEIAAFVARANEHIKGERYRPRVYARAPRNENVLLDLRGTRQNDLRLEGAAGAAHYLLEDGRGVRLLDFHGSGVTPVRLVRPPGEGPLYLRRLDDGSEQSVPRVDGPVLLATLERRPTQAGSRGAAQDAFNQLFALAFDGNAVEGWTRHADEERTLLEAAARSRDAELRSATFRRTLGQVAIGAGVAAALAAGGFALSAHQLNDGVPASESQRDVAARNESITTRNRVAAGLLVGGAAAVGTGLWLLWPRRSDGAASQPVLGFFGSPSSAHFEATWRF